MRFFADCSAVTNSKLAVSSFCDGELGTIMACTFDASLTRGTQFNSGIRRGARDGDADGQDPR